MQNLNANTDYGFISTNGRFINQRSPDRQEDSSEFQKEMGLEGAEAGLEAAGLGLAGDFLGLGWLLKALPGAQVRSGDILQGHTIDPNQIDTHIQVAKESRGATSRPPAPNLITKGLEEARAKIKEASSQHSRSTPSHHTPFGFVERRLTPRPN